MTVPPNAQRNAPLKPVRNLKLADAIAEHLEQLILEGALRPGEKLAAERELAERLEVSRPSLREALEKLQARGLLETSKSGTHVTKFMAPLTEPLAAMMQSNEQALIDYLEYRSLVEGEAARLAAIRATDIEIDAIRECLNRMREAHKIDDPGVEAEADADLHMLVYQASHNIVMLHIMRAFSEMLRHGVLPLAIATMALAIGIKEAVKQFFSAEASPFALWAALCAEAAPSDPGAPLLASYPTPPLPPAPPVAVADADALPMPLFVALLLAVAPPPAPPLPEG